MADVQLEIIDISTGQTIGTFSLTICTPQTYELDLGSYRFKATYLLTGEVQTYDTDIIEGVNTPHDFIFTPKQPPVMHNLTVDSTPIQGIPFTLEKVVM